MVDPSSEESRWSKGGSSRAQRGAAAAAAVAAVLGGVESERGSGSGDGGESAGGGREREEEEEEEERPYLPWTSFSSLPRPRIVAVVVDIGEEADERSGAGWRNEVNGGGGESRRLRRRSDDDDGVWPGVEGAACSLSSSCSSCSLLSSPSIVNSSNPPRASPSSTSKEALRIEARAAMARGVTGSSSIFVLVGVAKKKTRGFYGGGATKSKSGVAANCVLALAFLRCVLF